MQRFVKSDPASYQVSPEEAVFSLEYLQKHGYLAVEFFLGLEEKFGTIGHLFVGAIFGLCICLYLYSKQRSKLLAPFQQPLSQGQKAEKFPGDNQLTRLSLPIATAAFISYGLLILVSFSYYWGNLHAPITMRLGIIYLPIIVMLALVPLAFLLNYKPQLTALILILALAQITVYWPVAAKNEHPNTLSLTREYKDVLDFLEENYPDRNIVIFTATPNLYTPHRWGSVTLRRANKHIEKYYSFLKQRIFQEAIVIQHVKLDGEGTSIGTHLRSDYKLETLFERNFHPVRQLRISRVMWEDMSIEEAPLPPEDEPSPVPETSD